MSSPEERQRELDELKKYLGASFKQDDARTKTDLTQQFRNEIALSKKCASQGDELGAILEYETALAIARYLDTLK